MTASDATDGPAAIGGSGSAGRAIVAYAEAELARLAVPADAGPMAAYMKTEEPFWGVKRPARRTVERELKRRYPPETRQDYEAYVSALWACPHRETRYLAVAYARAWRRHVVWECLPLYERMIREGAWWDFVDDIAANLVGPALEKAILADEPRAVELVERWVRDGDMWVRRTAILYQLKYKADTDTRRLFAICTRLAPEREFFIRKAIGWALREYAKTAPELVHDYLVTHRDQLSGLSFREGSRHLVKAGLMSP